MSDRGGDESPRHSEKKTMQYGWTKSDLAILRKMYTADAIKKIAKRLHRSVISIRSKAIQLKLRRKQGCKAWSAEEIEALRSLYPNRPTAEVSAIMNRSISSVNGAADLNNIKKSPEYLQTIYKDVLRKHALTDERCIAARFKQGHISHNKGKKGICAPGCEKSWFKKGHLPANTKHDGAITVRWEKTGHHGKKRPIQFIRTGLGKWEYLHVYLWKKANGKRKVPKGFRVMFRDRDSMNTDLKNLVLRSDADAMRDTQMYDEVIAMRLSMMPGARGKHDKVLAAKLLYYPEILQAKRNLLLLQQKTGRKAV